MRVTVIGATGNAGTAVMRALAADPAVSSPPLDPATGEPARVREVLTGVGQTSK